MKKMLIYIILTIVSLGIICFIVVYFSVSRMKLDLSGIFDTIEESNHKKAFFLNDINLDDGTYALYVKHEEFGEFMVLNEEALKENMDSLYVRKNLLLDIFSGYNLNNRAGVTLFKDNIFEKDKNGSVFKKFKIGTLANYAIPVKKYRIQGNRDLIIEKSATLKGKKNIYFKPPLFNFKTSRDFSFNINFPSITLPVTRDKDSWVGNRIASINGIEHREWFFSQEEGSKAFLVHKLENCIREKATSIADFEVIVDVNEETNNYLVQIVSGKGYALSIAEDEYKYMRVENYHNFQINAHFRATKEAAEQLYTMDFSDCFSEENSNKQKLIDAVNELVMQSAQPHLSIEKGEVELYGYKNTFTKSSEITEQLYGLWWLEIENNEY